MNIKEDSRYIPVTVKNPIDGNKFEWSALIDTGASVSCIPEKVIQALDLSPIGCSDPLSNGST